MKKLISIAVILVFVVACSATYDLPVLYHKNYVPGTHPLLRFDGYYTQSDQVKKPVYLYRNGSVWFAESAVPKGVSDATIANGNAGVRYSWGNYKISADTIYIERFHRAENSNNYRRITLKGIIRTDLIHWIQREENRQNPDTVNYDTRFFPTATKPDSSANWTRTKAQYNK
jgi:hypothetical protein